MDDKLDELLSDNSEFDAIKALLEEPEKEVISELLGEGPIVGTPNPYPCPTSGILNPPGGSFSYPTARSTESLQMIYQQVLPGGGILLGNAGARGSAEDYPSGSATMQIQSMANITVVAAYAYWNIVMAANDEPTCCTVF